MATDTNTVKTTQYVRFGPAERMEHMALLISFTMLVVTGLPQRYASYDIAKDFIGFLGGIESVRLMHRFFATMLMATAIYHGGAVSYKIFVMGSKLTMIPSMKDLKDAIQFLLYNIGLRKEHPRMPRYNFGEKAEYLAVVWGTILMIITGFMLWNPVATSKLLPSVIIPAARAAHSAEALLAALSIVIWHMYNVHIKRFNRSMFTGKLSHEAMEEEHFEELAELERLESGESEAVRVPTDIIEKRKKQFWPYATVMTIVLVGGLFYFVTFEDTALSTIERQPIFESVDVDPEIGDPEMGNTLWQNLPCSICHGERGEGVPPIPMIDQTELSFEDFAAAVRIGPSDMPAFGPQDVSDEDIAHLYAWLRAAD